MTENQTPEKLTADLEPVEPAAASLKKRTIRGRILGFSELGMPSTGPTIFEPGSLTAPAELDRVKLLVQHDTYAAAVGYMTALDITDESAEAEFYLPEGDAGDDVLNEAKNGLRDGLSVGVTITEYDYGESGEVMHVKAAELTEVSVVTIPAYRSARISTVTAAKRQTPKGTIKVTENQTPTEVKAEQFDYEKLAAALAPMMSAQITPPAPTRSNGLQLDAGADLSAVAAAASAAYADGMAVSDITAALNDIVPADDAGKGFLRPQWVGEVWQASRTLRPFFDGAARRGKVEGLTVEGWRYKLDGRPEVADYEGNKTAIPSTGKVVTEPVKADVVRKAGGWDVDRAFYDLGTPNMFEALLIAATESYKRQSEDYVVDKLIEAATEVDAGKTFAGSLAQLGAAAVDLGANLSIISMSPDMWLQFAELGADEVPWWLKNQGELSLGTTTGTAGGLSFTANKNLAPGTILAADNRAYTPFELPNLIKAEAVNIGNGGIDVGVFGYVANIVNDPRAVLKVTSSEPAA